MQADPRFAINQRIRSRLKAQIGRRKAGRSWQELVGYSLDDLLVHLERQFQRGMTWQNRGLWQIDHIIPLAQFKFQTLDDPEFRAAWALTNLRPIWSRHNLDKRAHRTLLI